MLIPVLLVTSLAANNATRLSGAGSTLLCSVMNSGWASGFEAVSGVGVNYVCDGSGKGKAALLSGEVDFAGTDAVLEGSEIREGVQLIPVVVSPTAIVFNLPGVSSILFTRDILAKIFAGTITNWSDPQIAMMNPLLNLPKEPIEVVVRNDSSGTTEIVTSGLVSFANWTPNLTSTSMWPAEHKFVTRIDGSTALLNYIKATPYTVSYSGASGALSHQIPFASVINKVGVSTIPGWDDATKSAESLVLDPETLTGSPVDGQGYPLAGVSYIGIAMGSAKICSVLDFIYWLSTSSVAESVMSSNSLTPLSRESVNLVLNKLASQCPDPFPSQRLTDPVTVDTPTRFSKLLHTVGYSYHYSIPLRYIIQGATQGSALASLETVHRSSKSEASIPVGVGLLVAACNFGIAVPSIKLTLQDIRGIFSRSIVSWNDPRIRGGNSYVPPTQRRISIVVEKGATWVEKLLETLGWSADSIASFTPDIVMETVTDVGIYLQKHPGSLAVLPHEDATQWSISLIHPVYNDTPMLPSLEEVSRAIDLDTYNPGAGGGVDRRSPSLLQIYPFFYMVYLTVSKELGSNGFEYCGQKIPPEAELASWVAGYDKMVDSTSLLEKALVTVGLYPVSEAVRMSSFVDLKEIQCNGATVFPEPAKGKMVLYVSIFGAIGGALILGGVVGLLVKWRASMARFNNLYGATVIATETAEAVACLDFESMQKLENLSDPDRIQQAMISIVRIMKEFTKYIPQHVIRSVQAGRGLADESESEDHSHTHSHSKSNGTGGSKNSQHNAGGVYIQSSGSSSYVSRPGLGLKNLGGKSIRFVAVMTVRPSLSQIHSTGGSQVTSVEDAHAVFLTKTINTIETDTRGMLHRIQEDAIVATWGSLGGLVSRSRITALANKCVVDAPVVVGVAVGQAFCGSLGTEMIKTYHVLGSPVEDSSVLSRVAQICGASCLLPPEFGFDSFSGLVSPFFSVASPATCRPLSPAIIFPTHQSPDHPAEEWMYSLADLESAPSEGLPLFFSHLHKADYSSASATLAAFNAATPSDRLGTWLAESLPTIIPLLKQNQEVVIEAGVSGGVYLRSQGVALGEPVSLVRQVAARSDAAH